MSLKCNQCKSDKFETEITTLQCKHKFCWICIEKYLKNNLQSKNKCPDSGCNYILKDNEVRKILCEDDIDRYEEICKKKIPNIHACLLPECGEVVTYDDANTQYKCKNCGLYNCIRCKKAHKGMSCGEQTSSKTGQTLDVVCKLAMKAAKDRLQLKMVEWKRSIITETDKNILVPNSEVFTCSKCSLDIAKGAGVILRNCLHPVCRKCLNEHVRSCLSPQVGCPIDPCTSLLEDRECRGILNNDQLACYEAKSMRQATKYLLNPGICRGPNCDYLCELKDGANVWKCPKCDTVNCVDCNAVHVNQTCEEYSRKAFDAKTKSNIRIRKKEWIQCPDCRTLLHKMDRSRNWTRCSNCRVELCWALQIRRWGPKGRGDTSGGCKCTSEVPCCEGCNGCFPVDDDDDDGYRTGPTRSHSFSSLSSCSSFGSTCPKCKTVNCVDCDAVHLARTGKEYSKKTLDSKTITEETATDFRSKRSQSITDLSKITVLANMDVFTCVICLRDIGEKTGVMLRNCCHKICRECLNEYLRNSYTTTECPRCPCQLHPFDEMILSYERKYRGPIDHFDYEVKYKEIKNCCQALDGDLQPVLGNKRYCWECSSCRTINCVESKTMHFCYKGEEHLSPKIIPATHCCTCNKQHQRTDGFYWEAEEDSIVSNQSMKDLTDENKTVAELNFNENTVIKIIDLLRIEIRVLTLDGRDVTVPIRKTDKVADLKKKIIKKIRFDRFENILKYKDKIVDYDDASMKECDIVEGSIIQIIKRLQSHFVVYVRIFDGRVCALQVTSTDTIEGLRSQLEQAMSISPKEGILMYKGVILEDDNSVEHYQIEDTSVIDYTMNPLRNFDSAVMDQSQCIMTKWNADKKESILLKDDATVEECGFKENGIIAVTDLKGIKVLFRSDEGSTVSLQMRRENTISDILDKINVKIRFNKAEHYLRLEDTILDNYSKTIEQYGITDSSVINIVNRNKVELYVRLVTRPYSVRITMMKRDRIIDLKKKLEFMTGLPSHDLVLVYCAEMLDDSKTIESCDLESGSSIIAVTTLKGGMKLCAVIYKGDRITIACNDNDRIIVIKGKIHQMSHLTPGEQSLVYDGTTLDDNQTVAYYNIEEESDIIVNVNSREMEISVTIEGMGTITLPVKNIDRIINIKKSIRQRMIAHGRDIPLEEQLLKFKGDIIRDINTKLYECHVIDNSNIDVSIVEKLNITLESPDTPTQSLELYKSDRIRDVKEKIEKKIGLPANEIKLQYMDRPLEDDNTTVVKCNIRDGSNLGVSGLARQKIRGICVIISNEHFCDGFEDRSGAEVDVINIKNTFEPMGYDVQIVRDLEKKDVLSTIEKIKMSVEDDHQILAVFVMSHGVEKGFYTVDGSLITFDSMWIPFTDRDFPQFRNKPRLFFFVCCRLFDKAMIEPEQLFNRFHPQIGNMFIGWAAYGLTPSNRSSLDGTLYVHYLCKVIRDNTTWTISQIHQEVCRIFVRELKFPNYQAPYCENFLTGPVHLAE